MTKTRIEHDALGDVAVPANHLWGAQTQRSIENFPIGRRNYVWGRDVIRGFGILKKACALANPALGQLSPEKTALIVQAAEEVIAGKWDAEFPLVVFQTGSGTQSNMNANEVIANRAIQIAGGVVGSKKPINPNDDVNHSQSSNDTFPAVMHIAAVEVIENQLLPAIATLARTLKEKSLAFADIVMTGRTHLQDATPITLGQVISGWHAAARSRDPGIRATLPGLYELAIGGTAVGTGLNAHPNFGATVAEFVARETGKPFISAPNKFAALSAHDGMVAASRSLRVLAGARHENRQRRALVRLRPAHRHRRIADPGKRARLLHHARQNQPDPMRSADHGRRAGFRQRRMRSPSAAARAISSSTSSSR